MIAAPTHDTPHARRARHDSPDFSWCARCGMPWVYVPEHVVRYTDGSGLFALCETCWEISTIDERHHYYETLFHSWSRGHGADIDLALIHAAIDSESRTP